MNGLAEIPEYRVKSKPILGPPNARGPCHMARMVPPLKGPDDYCTRYSGAG